MALRLCRLFTNSVNLQNVHRIQSRGIKMRVRTALIDLKKRQDQYFEEISKEERNELLRRSNFLEWNYSSEIFAFGKRLHEDFHPEVLVQAFTHESYISLEKQKQIKMGIEDPQINLKVNDELAAEGEKIIQDYSTRYVAHFYPRIPLEGLLSISSYLTSDEVLGYISKNLGTTHLILSGDYPVEVPTYSKTLKAIVGALKVCQSVERSEIFVRDLIVTYLVGKDINDLLNINNPLEVLSDILKREGKEAPEPRIIGQAGMNTILANYHVGIYSNKQLIGHYFGETIDTAIEMAAFDALKRLFHTTDSCQSMTYDVKDVSKKINNLKLSEWKSSAFEK